MDPFAASYFLLWLVVLIQGAVLVFLLRQVGAIYLGERDAIERDGIKPGEELPRIEGRDERGSVVRFPQSSARQSVLIYTVPTCEICRELLPSISELSRRIDGLADFVLVIESPHELLAKYRRDTSTSLDMVAIDRAAARRLRVRVSPFVHVVDQSGVVRAKGLVNSVDHVAHLLVMSGVNHPSLEEHVELRHGVAS